MRKWIAGIAATVAMLFIFVLGGVQGEIDSRLPGSELFAGGTAHAAPAVCRAPSLTDVAGDWVVRSAKCTSPGCKRAHLSPGDRLRFERNISGEATFSADFVPAATGRRTKTDGYTLRSDGVAGLKGAITLEHDPLDGSPLDLHWLIVQFRAQDADGFGTCSLSGHVQFCDSEPGAGATSCSSKQHEGTIIIGPP